MVGRSIDRLQVARHTIQTCLNGCVRNRDFTLTEGDPSWI